MDRITWSREMRHDCEEKYDRVWATLYGEGDEVQQAFERAQGAGLPVVYGENPDEDVYHYHPSNQQVKEWAQQAGFEVLRETNGEIWYYHILVQKI